MDRNGLGRACLTRVAIASVALLGASHSADAEQFSFNQLHQFCDDCADGANPAGRLLLKDGRLYGISQFGGSPINAQGVVFEMTRSGAETVLHTFLPPTVTSNDGENPVGGLASDSDGNLYGTTLFGGGGQGGPAAAAGTVFEVKSNRREKLVYIFCSEANCADGATPVGDLILDGKGNIYGTTSAGGANAGPNGNGAGTAFKIAPDGRETVLYNFCAAADCADGLTPSAGLVTDKAGNLYGVASAGGAATSKFPQGCGVVFELSPRGKETILHTFGGPPDDGCVPFGDLIFDNAGNLYGTTSGGGSGDSGLGFGTVFEITRGGEETVLYNFCSASGCMDGASPSAGLVMDAAGKLYGPTSDGGANANGGVVFELTRGGIERVLYSFCSQPGCADGSQPLDDALILDQKGDLYGATAFGGRNGDFNSGAGTVFELVRR